MIIKFVRVMNFRSVLDGAISCDALTALVGPNGCGKSTFLRALDLFYSPSPNVTRDDFYNRNTENDIEIAVTFTDLTAIETERFRSRMTGPDLAVVRVLSAAEGKESGRYYGFRMHNPDFAVVRSKSGREFNEAYKAVRESGGYAELPVSRSQAEGQANLETWENEHPDRLVPGRDDGQFFGFTNVARGYLGDITRFLFIPAVRDAGDDVTEGKSSPITTLMDLVVRAALASRAEIATLRQETQQRYDALTDPATLPELGNLANNLSGTLQQYYQDTGVSLKWLPTEAVSLPPPRADVRLVEDEFEVPVSRTGHGLQRAFILALLQHLAVARAARDTELEIERVTDGGEDRGPEIPELNLILGIEEPELYQHPNRQRHFARVLFDLASGKIPGVANRTQILYATHSALMVGIDRFNQVRRVSRSVNGNGGPKITAVAGTTWDKIAERVWIADGSPGQKYTESTIRPRVASLMTPWMNEGFFADVVVLVEGEDERAAILGVAQSMGHDLEGDGCSVIPCNGKASIDRPAAIFSELGISTYIIWDGDKSLKGSEDKNKEAQSIEANRRLLRLVGGAAADWPSCIEATHACFEDKLESTMRDEIGNELFAKLRDEQAKKFGYQKPSQATKNPSIIAEILKGAAAEGKKSHALETIVAAIVAMRRARK